MNISVISSSENLLQLDNINEVYVPTSDGTIAILPGHMNLITTLDIGELRIKSDDVCHNVLFNGGILQCQGDEILILVDEASLSDDLVAEEIDQAIELAEKQISSTLKPSDLIQLERKLKYEKFKRERV